MDATDQDTPDFRADIIAETMRQISKIVGAASYSAVFKSVMDALKLDETQCSSEIMAATSLFIRSGLVRCNSYNPSTGTISYGCDTWLKPSLDLTHYTWSERLYALAEEDEE